MTHNEPCFFTECPWVIAADGILEQYEVKDVPHYKLRRSCKIIEKFSFFEFEQDLLTYRRSECLDSGWSVKMITGGLELGVDELGVNQIFVFKHKENYVCASSCLYLLIRFLGRYFREVSLSIDERYWNAMLAGDSFLAFQPVSKNTGVKKISRLIVDEVLFFNRYGNISILKKSDSRKSLASIEQCQDQLIEHVKSWDSCGHPEFLNLSGGKDSRAVLFLLEACTDIDNIDFYHQPRGNEVCDILSIALANAYGKKLKHPDRKWRPVSFQDSMAFFLNTTAGRTFNYIPITRVAADDGRCSIHYIGGSGEVYRYPYYLAALNKRGVSSIPEHAMALSEVVSRVFSKGYAKQEARTAFKEEFYDGLMTVSENFETTNSVALLVGHYALFRNRDHFQGNNILRAVFNKQLFRFPLFLEELVRHSVFFYDSSRWNGSSEIFDTIFQGFPRKIKLPYDQELDAIELVRDEKWQDAYRLWATMHKRSRFILGEEEYSVSEELSAFEDVVENLRSLDLDISIDWGRFFSGTVDLFGRRQCSLARSSFAKCHALHRLVEILRQSGERG